MSRPLFKGKFLFTALSEGIVLSGRRFSLSAAAATRGMTEEKAVLMKGIMKTGTATADEAVVVAMPWVPDPVTGYYRPANRLREIDPAELRQIFLKNKA